MGPAYAADVQLFIFLSLPQTCTYGYEVELSHMGKNNGNPDLMCEKSH